MTHLDCTHARSSFSQCTVVRMARGVSLAVIVGLAGCPASPPSGTAPAASSSAAADAAVEALANERIEAIIKAEHRRSAAEITLADQQSRDVGVRRAAARALARIGGDASQSGLLRALSDEDSQVVSWAAYGLGFFCKGHEKESVAALVARALSLAAHEGAGIGSAAQVASATPPGSSTTASQAAAPASMQLDPMASITRSIGRCGAEQSEPTLVAWLGTADARAVHAAYALGDLATAKQRLREETLAALLNLASGSAAAAPAPEGLYPVGRLNHVPLTVVERIREVAAARLSQPGEARLYAVRALGHGGKPAVAELARVLGSPDLFNPAERAEAARALKRLGDAGQRALAEALGGLVPNSDPIALTSLVREDFGVLLATLEALDEPRAARTVLRSLAALAPAPDAPAAVVRRISWLRCGAAKLLAGRDYRDPLLKACDVTPRPSPARDADAGAPPPAGSDAASLGSIGARALVEVLGRAPIRGARLAIFRAIATSGDVRAREAALELLTTHDEVADSAALLAGALAAPESGVAGTAADVIAKQPQRAGEPPASKRKRGKGRRESAGNSGAAPASSSGGDEAPPLAPAPAVIKALLAALANPASQDDPELAASLMEAAGALVLSDALPRLTELCRSSYPTLREKAEKAIFLISGTKTTCEPPAGGGDAPIELQSPVHQKTTLTFQTDAGEMSITLDPELAPVIVTRIVDLARSGYYRGMVVHRVVPGFVTQFGAPYGDGFGGPAGRPAVRCETSPIPFSIHTVGIALAGRDTGSSQPFIMHGRYPRLDGQYAWVGTATGSWAALVDGDIIQDVKVSP